MLDGMPTVKHLERLDKIKQALSFDQIKDLNEEGILLRIKSTHNIEPYNIFKPDSFSKKDVKYDRSLMTRVVLFRLEGCSWDQIADYLYDFFHKTKQRFDDGGEADLKYSAKFFFSIFVSNIVKNLIKFNQKDLSFRITSLYGKREGDRLRKIVASLLELYSKLTGEGVEFEKVFKKLPLWEHRGRRTNFLEVCEYMYLKACIIQGVDYTSDRRLERLNHLTKVDRDTLNSNTRYYFTDDFRKELLTGKGMIDYLNE